MLLLEAKKRKKGQGIIKNSIVDDPAIKMGFIKCAAEESVMLCKDSLKKRIYGPIMVPGKAIFRPKDTLPEKAINGDITEDAMVYWSAATIESELIQLMQDSRLYDITLDHGSEKADATLMEIWLVKNENDWIYSNGFTKDILPLGSIIAGYQVQTDNLWSKIEAGEYNGFSIEGIYEYEIKNPKEEKQVLKTMHASSIEQEEKEEKEEVTDENHVIKNSDSDVDRKLEELRQLDEEFKAIKLNSEEDKLYAKALYELIKVLYI